MDSHLETLFLILAENWANGGIRRCRFKLKESNGSQVQGTALRIVIRLDPDRARACCTS